MVKTYEILVSGIVQGIGYRTFAVRVANKMKIRGSVKNLADGRVRVIAQGKEENINALIELLKTGPTFASVKDVDLHEKGNVETFKDFHIEY